MPSARWDVAVAADMCVDLILRGNVRPRFGQVEQLIEDYRLEVGGSANIFASQMAKLGARAGVLGAVGRDAFGVFLVDRLRETGVDVSRLKRDASLRTGLGVALTEPADRAILTYAGTIDALGPGDLPRHPERLCRHWHLASFFLLTRLRPVWKDFLKRCRDSDVTTSLDTNWDPEGRWHGVTEVLPGIDVFLPNEREAEAISGERSATDAARRLSRLGPLVVIKCGGDGVVAARGPDVWTLRTEDAAVTVPEVVDSVGAGDNFDAGFLRGWLRGRPIPECLALGHRCAVASLAAAGGLAGQIREPPLRGRRKSPTARTRPAVRRRFR
jgi:sugar/nucleoside kinase (ribokinase family)